MDLLHIPKTLSMASLNCHVSCPPDQLLVHTLCAWQPRKLRDVVREVLSCHVFMGLVCMCVCMYVCVTSLLGVQLDMWEGMYGG